ncbi:OmpA family protein [Costertonia aggregata]|uniref:OmpA family protein n=1 Tax=Costertonia aggregata TaxID=343403 RepID=A0A7H9AMB5_9FLAO|nr:OmpA family protein [Costertonia aggregata]QLG44513.1 OmpA family protein [Costertonia aggregata]
MVQKIVFIIFLFACLGSFSQEKKSKADALYFGYNYYQAIQEYQKEQKEKSLSGQQKLNLADSYFKVGKYENASKAFLEVLKNDSIMSSHDFNKMLQSLSKIGEKEKVKAFLQTKKNQLAGELIENAEFNYELLRSKDMNAMDFNIFNLVANSRQSDFSPTFYNDDLLFTSARPVSTKKIYGPTGDSYLDLYTSKITADGNISEVTKRLQGIPKSSYHKATPYYSQSLQKLFYIVSNEEDDKLLFDENGKNALAIGLATVSDGPDKSFNYLLRDLSTSFYYPFFDAKSQRLYFAANFEDSYGGTDIYYVNTNYGRIMSAPVNLGPRINTPGNEIAPYIFENSLYFSSDIFYGMGGMDVYKTNIQQDGTFSIPVNLGDGINSVDDDFGFIIRNEGDGLLGYFSSNRKGGIGNDDIYGFKIDEKPGLKTIAIKGSVTKSVGDKAIEKASIKVSDVDGNLLKEVYSDGDGAYQLEIPWKDTIKIKVAKEKHSVYEKEYNAQELEVVQSKPLDITLTHMADIVEEKEDQWAIKLNKFYFDKGKSNITPVIAEELAKVVDALKKFPEFQLRIESHTDSRGGGSTNFRLSQNRSDAIKKHLLENGVPASNILYSVGYGETKILNNCKNGVYCINLLHQKNERSLIVVLNYNLLK